MKIKEVLDRTAQIVLVDRQKEYNQVSKTEMHTRIAEAWSATLGHMVTAHEVALCMVQLKVIRAACQPGHEDSYVDACGYMAIAAEIMHEDPQDLPRARPLYNGCGDPIEGVPLHQPEYNAYGDQVEEVYVASTDTACADCGGVINKGDCYTLTETGWAVHPFQSTKEEE